MFFGLFALVATAASFAGWPLALRVASGIAVVLAARSHGGAFSVRHVSAIPIARLIAHETELRRVPRRSCSPTDPDAHRAQPGGPRS